MTPPPPPPFASLRIGEGTELSHTLTRTDLVRYAGASGDFNPMHHDDEAARESGLPSVFGHGMFSAGLVARALTAWLGPGSLRRYGVRFTKQTWPGDTLTAQAEITALVPDADADADADGDADGGLVEVDCRLVNAEGVPVVSGHAVAEVSPVPPGRRPPRLLEPSSGRTPLGDSPHIGRPLPSTVCVVERGPLRAFARALGDESAAYDSLDAAAELGFSSVPVPPTFPFALQYWGAFPERQPPAEDQPENPLGDIVGELFAQGGMILHGEEEFVYHRTPVAGDVLVGTGVVRDVYRKDSSSGKVMHFVVTETVFSDEAGTPVVTELSTLIHRL